MAAHRRKRKVEVRPPQVHDRIRASQRMNRLLVKTMMPDKAGED